MIVFKNAPMKQYTVIVNGQKSQTNDAGVFVIAVDNSKTYVSIQVEQGNHSILYPLNGHLAIPKNPNELPTIIIGTNDDYRLYKEFISLHTKIDNLSQAEVKQRKALGTEIDKLKRLLVERNFQACEIDRTTQLQMRVQEGRERYLPEITLNLNEFFLKARKLSLNLKHANASEYGKSVPVMKLYEAAYEYNYVHSLLKRNQTMYENAVAKYWEDDTLKTGFNSLLLYAVDTLNTNILKLNTNLSEIQVYCNGKKRDEQIEQGIKQRIDSVLPPIELMISDLEKRNTYFQKELIK